MFDTTERNSGGTLAHSSPGRNLLGGIVDKLLHFPPHGNKEGTFCCTVV